MYDTILFDLDGTLTDPKLGITKSIQYALNKLGIREDNLDSLAQFIGPPLLNTFREDYRFDEAKAAQAIAYYREYFSEYGLYENKLYELIPELFKGLQRKKKEIVLASSKPTLFAEKILTHFKIRDYFTLVVGSNLDGTRVQKDEVIACVLAEFQGRRLEQFVMVGDRKHDIIGAKANQIASIGVTYGYGSMAEIQKEEPTHIIHSVADLIKLLCAD
ncbi:MAG TPA: HAD hydrolase-like protein [Bacillota bacterium]|nr:HAD hydrolase-like protein [Bacillota bacterium]